MVAFEGRVRLKTALRFELQLLSQTVTELLSAASTGREELGYVFDTEDDRTSHHLCRNYRSSAGGRVQSSSFWREVDEEESKADGEGSCWTLESRQ